MIHINEIKLEGKSEFVKQFNMCSDLYRKMMDYTLSDKEREEYFEQYQAARWKLEMEELS